MSSASSVTIAQDHSSSPPSLDAHLHEEEHGQQAIETTQNPVDEHRERNPPQATSPSNHENAAPPTDTRPKNDTARPNTSFTKDASAGSSTSSFTLERVKTSYQWLQDYSITGNLKIDLLTLVGVVASIYIGKKTLDYARWTTRKDFREACESDVEHNRTITPRCKEALATSAAAPPLRRRSNLVNLDTSDGQTAISFSIENDSFPGFIVAPLLRSVIASPLYFVSMFTFTVACLVATAVYFRPRMEPFHPVLSAAREHVMRITGSKVTAIQMYEHCTNSMSDTDGHGKTTLNQIPLAFVNSAEKDTESADGYFRFPAKVAKWRIEALKQDTFRLAKLWMNLSSIKRFQKDRLPTTPEQSHALQESHDRVERQYVLKRSDFRRSATESSSSLVVFESFASAFDSWLNTESGSRLRNLAADHSKSATQADVWAEDCVGLGAFEWVKSIDNGKRLKMRPVPGEENQHAAQSVDDEPTESILEYTDRELRKAARLEYPRSHKFTLGLESEVHYCVFCLRGQSQCNSTLDAILCRLKRADMKRLIGEILSWDDAERGAITAKKYDLLPSEGQHVIEQVMANENDERRVGMLWDPRSSWELVGIGGDASAIEENAFLNDVTQQSHPFFVLRRVTRRDTVVLNGDPAGSALTGHGKLEQPQHDLSYRDMESQIDWPKRAQQLQYSFTKDSDRQMPFSSMERQAGLESLKKPNLPQNLQSRADMRMVHPSQGLNPRSPVGDGYTNLDIHISTAPKTIFEAEQSTESSSQQDYNWHELGPIYEMNGEDNAEPSSHQNDGAGGLEAIYEVDGEDNTELPSQHSYSTRGLDMIAEAANEHEREPISQQRETTGQLNVISDAADDCDTEPRKPHLSG
ncbi:MAG: hypothetical protein M1831_007090 [Alyxoria varia]|nr:MAG: hypothetical protein M1831_007090 [Alyxoria varia]